MKKKTNSDNKTKIILLGVGILILVGLVGFLVVRQQNSNSNPNPLTPPSSSSSNSSSSSGGIIVPPATTAFASKDGTLSLSYAYTWEITSNQNDNFYGLAPISLVDEWEAAYGNRGFSISSFKIISSTDSPKSWADTNLGTGYNTRYDTTVNGYPAYYILNDRGSDTDHWYVISHNGVILFLSFRQKDGSSSSTVKDYSQYLNDFNYMVNSVKFLN